ncbi:MAG TPA: hypothetical protein PLL86_25845, partial [Leptospiraceae bacterium]|nr:hypothetical protein [Leptospiraceae bacterium]
VEIQDNDAEAKGQSQILLPLAEDKHKIDALQVTNKKAKEQSKSKSKKKKVFTRVVLLLFFVHSFQVKMIFLSKILKSL